MSGTCPGTAKVVRSDLLWGLVGFQSVRSLPTTQRVGCRILAVATIFLTVAGCGLNQREQQIADTNQQILVVRQRSEDLAAAIYALPDEPQGPEDFTEVVATYEGYRTAVDRLSVLIRRLGEILPHLTTHLSESFDPEVEAALDRCESAVEVFQGPQVEDAVYQSALTSLCLCVEQYAAAVTAVSRQYSRLAG